MTDFRNPKMMRAFGQVQTSVLISQEFYRLCKENFIKFSDALRVGASILLADKGVLEYDNNLNLSRKLFGIQNILKNTSQKFYDLLAVAKSKGLDVSQFEDG